ncbi:heavy-metal-associated domain-containing protein [Halosolutus gelatinilyticus]|uniref:heavy-metal-associated domain-containing protein n=1 Tax=Halosolutus gelatinilyticus TaxID=2931975 RepID=UPI001FF3E00F|nr:heavy metal-associated domain-containing protein [Halosolutus gelatinilyticus]
MSDRQTIAVSGTSCARCERTVETALEGVDGVRRVDADHDAETVEVGVDDDVDERTIGDAVRDAGYEFVG